MSTVSNWNSLVSLWQVKRVLEDLLCWSVHPHPEPLSQAWLENTKAGLSTAISSAMDQHEADSKTSLTLIEAKRLAFEFATLLHEHPELSTIPIEQWTILSYRKLFDDLDLIEATLPTIEDVTRNRIKRTDVNDRNYLPSPPVDISQT